MKLRAILSIFFIIATLVSALHEIEHITGEHDSSTCQICIVDDHSAAVDVISSVALVVPALFTFTPQDSVVDTTHTKKSANHSTAPPFLS